LESKVGFLGGMDRDSSLSKRDSNKYYDALNIRVLTDNGLSTGSVINEKGNSLLFKLPASLSGVYTFESDSPFATLAITTSLGAVLPDLIGTTSITEKYNAIMTTIEVISDIEAGYYKVFLNGSKIYFVGLTDLVSVASNGTITTVVSDTSNFKIIGLGTMRDWIVIFTTDINTLPFGSASVGNGQIWKCRYDKVNEIIEDTVLNTLVPSIHLVYNGILGFTTSNRVGEIVSRYQDDLHGKVFFIDGVNTMKHINILDPDSTGLSLSDLEMVPDVAFTQPKITKVIKGGNLKSGSIQYSYQLFNYGGVETSFAPASGIVHLTDKNEYSSNTLNYKGVAPDTVTGKSIVISIDSIDVDFDYIRLISVYYTSQEGAPEINIIEEKSVPSTGSIEFIDDGSSIGVYSTIEYNSTGGRLFIPGTIATKNNYLIAANIKEEYFDFDGDYTWDSRAFRWRDNVGTWEYKIDGDIYVNADLASVPETADCSIPRASQDGDWKRNQLTGNLGGSGINAAYEFILTPIKIDDDSDDTKTCTNTDVTNQDWSSKLDSTYIDNDSYTSYASPINREQLVGYTRDEIYRFGVVFFDSKGRQSFVKWIGDIKMPRIDDIDYKVTYNTDPIGGTGTDMYDYNTVFEDSVNGGIYANVLGINFTLSNVPTGLSYRIVRVRREQQDKYILGQGLMGCSQIMDDSNVSTYNHIGEMVVFGDTDTNYNDAIGTDPYLITLKSPEVLFNDSIKPTQGDRVEIVALSNNVSYSAKLIDPPTPLTELYETVFTNKIKSLTPEAKQYASVVDGIKAEDTLNIDASLRYTIQSGGTRLLFLNHDNAWKGTALALGLNSTFIVGNTDKHIILNYTKDSSLVQYGGVGFSDRINNLYIACGNLDSGIVYGGDTFIGMFEYINAMLYTNHGAKADTTLPECTEIVYIPLESTINTELRHGSSFSKGQTHYQLCETVAFGNSVYPGASNIWGDYFADYEDVYQYNTAYSAESIGKTFTVKPQFFVNSQVSDYKVIVSEKHINNQITDSWTKWLYNNMIEVNSAYGPITKIITFRNRLVFFQDNAFGLLGFEDRQLLKDNTGLPLTLGVGGILSNFQYVSEKTGTKSKFGVIDTGSYLYFVDLNNRKFMLFDGNTDQCVSDKDNLSSFFRTFDYGDALLFDSTSNYIGIHGVFDPISKRVLYTMLGNESKTFSYNEVLNNFESFYSFLPTIYENTDFGVVSVNPSDLGEVWLHGNGIRGSFYGATYPSYITSILAPHPDNKKVFTNIEFNSYVEVAGVDAPLVTVDALEFWNSFQTTGVILPTHPDTIRRRFRTWRYQLPKVNSLRLMDYSLFAKFTFTNDVAIDKYFRLDDITIHYLVPML